MNAIVDSGMLLDAEALRAAQAALDAMMGRVWAELAPRPPMTILQWAETYRELSPEESALPGRYSVAVTPALAGILETASEPNRRKVVCMKSAQAGYTAGVVCNVMGYHIHHRPSVQVAVFPRERSAKDFAAEKLDPMIRATGVLNDRVSLKSRAQGNSNTRKHFTGGLIKLVGANSPSDLKSTSARVVIVEEPDDVSVDVKGQGDGIKLVEERAKTYPDHIIMIGGTPTAKGASSIEAEWLASDQRLYQVPCHACGESHALEWRNVTIPEDPPEAAPREVYGRHLWEEAFYACPHCGAVWTDDERIANLHRGAWVATAQSHVAGFHHPELLSTFAGSRVPVLARKFLEAQAKLDAGDAGEMIAFHNSTLGLPWEYRGELPEEDELRDRAEAYAEWSVPAGALVPLLTVDVQHDRLAVTVWVVGRGEEMWLAYWGELYGRTVVAQDGAWLELEALLDRPVRHASGAELAIACVGIDTSDGQTSDAAYAFVRRHHRADRPVLALKGAPDAEGRIEIWSPPKNIDPNYRATKAARFGVQIHTVGTAKAKDLILGWAQEGGRVRLTGAGPGRMHWYAGVRDDFYEQLLGEIKIPSRMNPRKRAWKPRTDRRNEALDCTVYAVYLCRHLRLHLRRPVQWDLAEMQLRQVNLLPTDAPVEVVAEVVQAGATVPAESVNDTPIEASPAAATDYLAMLNSIRRDRRAR